MLGAGDENGREGVAIRVRVVRQDATRGGNSQGVIVDGAERIGGGIRRLVHYLNRHCHRIAVGQDTFTYKAFDERLQIEIALKVIKPSWVGDDAAQSLFVREARAAARIRHPNVASVLFLNDGPEDFF